MSMLSMPKDKIKIVLFENIHPSAVRVFNAGDYRNIETYPHAPDGEALLEAVKDAQIVGIRSGAKLTRDVFSHAEKLFCVGCFCIGTNQVDLMAARERGIAVFNAPYSNTRSVAELVLGEALLLLRRVPERSSLAHDGVWRKSAKGSFEARGKILGIVGYGHIGSQLSVLAENIGMRVRYHDIERKLSHGNATPLNSLQDLLASADVVSLHVPQTPETKGMIGEEEIRAMKPGACLINASRGNVVDLEALAAAIRDGHLAGAAVDVFPREPASAGEELVTPLRNLPNVILTPHVGGSTQEAQENIGAEVAAKLIRYSDNGSTTGAVNISEVTLPLHSGRTRFLHIHRNAPGVLNQVNEVFSSRQLNIAGQFLQTDGEIGYVVVDVDGILEPGHGVREDLAAIEGTIRVRFLN